MLRARDNPFAVHRVLRERYRLGEAAWAKLFARLDAQHGRGALVGPQGAGKTTMLEDLADRLAARGWKIRLLRLSADREQWTLPALRHEAEGAGPQDFILLDGAEQLGVVAWWRFRFWTRSAGGLVITSHRGRRLPLLHRCETSPALLHEIVAALGVKFSREECVALHRQHRGNVRNALRELYDRHADADETEIRGFSAGESLSH
jgi:hypothetical protein